MASLRSPPTSFPQYVMDQVLPKVPNPQNISAKLLLTQSIELEKSCETFLEFSKKSKKPENLDNLEQNRLDESIVSLEVFIHN